MDDDREDPGPYNPRNIRGINDRRGRRVPIGGNAGVRRPEQQQMRRYPYRHERPAQAIRAPLQGPQGNRNQSHFNRENNPPRGNQSGPNDNHQRNFPRNQFVGFKKLEEIAKSDTKETLNKLMESKQAFIELIQSPIEKFDMFVVIIEIIAKISHSAFDETKSRMLLDICNSNFIVSLKSYLMDLPYAQTKSANNLYWKDQESQVAFWRNFVDFCECIVNTSPTMALNKCRSLLEATSMACLVGLNDRHNFVLPEEYANKLTELRERMADFEKKSLESKPSKGFRFEDGAPPENFRELSIMPTREDLLQRSYIRPNIVDGGYQDVDHYLDVQFRLLREDCFGPLRDGLNQFLHDQHKKRYDNIRIFRDVKFLKPYVSQTRVGSLVQLDIKRNKMFKRTNWANNKRFIFGSLVLFTKDNCKTFIAATILDREEDYLHQGMIPVSVIGQDFDIGLYNDDLYTMIESEVYFEPYYHVLKVLKDPTFPEHLSMKQYIVHVNPQPQPPSYLTEDTKFEVETLQIKNKMPDFEDLHILDDSDDKTEAQVQFTVLNEETWPMKDALSFDESQYDAYQLSLTHEFAVVQGPPGTGKTYLGIKVAKTLFENLQSTTDCLMLVICYTNHALDQFLEALLGITDSIVRIGGQSRNAAMERINLNNLRRHVSIHGAANKPFFDQKMSLKDSISEFQKALVKLDVLLNGVIKCDYIKKDVPEVCLLSSCFYDEALGGRDPLYYWLFEHSAHFLNDVNYLLEETAAENDFAKLEKENRKRTGVMLDEQDKDNTENIAYRKVISSFSMDIATSEINKLVAQYRKTEDALIKQNILAQLQFLDSYRTMFNEMCASRHRRINLKITKYTNFNNISAIDRWSLYFTWIEKHTRDSRAEVGRVLADVNTATTMFEESRMMLDMRVLAGTKIVGMTTSGAARVRKLLQALNPPIVIVEEAAEVLEQHIISSLTKGCKHLILIGDHQQLRPSASHMKLAKHYNIEVSLFERMINNGIHSRRLSVQHRMRPEIAALICPHIYQELENHPSVYDFPDVKGITNNVYFFNHEFKEEEVQENMSRTNHREADLTLALANYLVQQGYSTDEVTVLAAYKGQMFYMRKESDKYSHLKGMKITVVDNYQGEESKIILLSLVRCNDDNKIGFLGTANRICVALSRAKEGFYIFGNIEILKSNSDLWKNIAATLESNNSLGDKLVLQCQSHSENMTIIEKLEDFEKVPEGGCLLPCETVMRCGHKCQLMCHGYDREHNTHTTKCMRKCERIQCILDHVCPKKCFEDCGPCKRKIVKKLPCGHEMQVYCYQEPEDPDINCRTLVQVTLPNCKHKAEKMCFVKIKEVRCEVNCEFRVEKCGHSCNRKCHVMDDPKHERYLCMKACAKAKSGCTANLEGDRGDHQCRNKCYETCDKCEVKVPKSRSSCKHKLKVECNVDPDTVPCLKNCARSLPCGHFCKKRCNDPCGDCNVQVTKTIPDCLHIVEMKCKDEPTRRYCEKNCERTLVCGHRCKARCAEECDATKCMEPSLRKMTAPCGHIVTLPCHAAKLSASELEVEQLLGWCESACSIELACGHMCAGTCARCCQGRLHLPCRQTCNQINICQHQCEEPCNQICPPCKKPCEIKCKHSQCNQLCGAPCKSCKEVCGRRCPHGACEKRCGEACSVGACSEPCPLTLACGHECRGLCGQPCPPVCNLCSPETFPVDFLGDPFEDTDRFVLLEDCGHVMEVENMDNLMKGDSDTVKIRCCPFCRKPIINTGRYKDLVNATFKNEINVIKTRVYGTKKIISEAWQQLKAKLRSYSDKYETELGENNTLRHNFMSLRSIFKSQKNVSKLELDMELVCLDILDMVSECYKSYKKSNATELNTKVEKQIKLVCKIFIFDTDKRTLYKISEQQQKDVKLEIRRLDAIIQLAKLTSHPAYAPIKAVPSVAAAFKAANEAVFEPRVFRETETRAALKKLQEAVKVSGVVTQQERELIVRAIGLKAGHWYKCPNGHFYCIGECGGAMQQARCPECGEAIGGGSHRLLPTNAHAPEMDGSRFAAWSDQYNNMANFEL